MVAKSLIGWLGILLNIILFPVTSWIAPIYKGIATGEWIPTLILYGGLLIGSIVKIMFRDKAYRDEIVSGLKSK